MEALIPTDRDIKRFWSKINKTQSCWLWTGSRRGNGYAQFRIGGKNPSAHRFMLIYVLGIEIPPTMQVDHLCRVKHCVNPEHLEIVTGRENLVRGNGFSGRNFRKTHCANGHEFTPATTWYSKAGHRHCRICRNGNWRRMYVQRRDSGLIRRYGVGWEQE